MAGISHKSEKLESSEDNEGKTGEMKKESDSCKQGNNSQKDDMTDKDDVINKDDNNCDADTEEANTASTSTSTGPHDKNQKSKSRFRRNFPDQQKFEKQSSSRRGFQAVSGRNRYLGAERHYHHPVSNFGAQRHSPHALRFNPFLTEGFFDFSERRMFESSFGFGLSEQVHLVFPDAEEDPSEEHSLIKVIHPKYYHVYPDKAPLNPKDGPYTELNKNKEAPGLVESTVEDTTPRDERGRFVTPPYPVNYTCGWCGKTGVYMLVCRGCKRSRYCDKFCHESHWPWHRHKCFNDPENAKDTHIGKPASI